MKAFLLSVFLLIPLILPAQKTYLNFPIDTVVRNEYFNYRGYIKYDNAGKIHLVHSRTFGSGSETREILYWNNVSGDFIPYQVTHNNIDDNYITFGFDNDGKIHLGWERRDAGNIFQLIYKNNRNVSSGFGDSVWITTGGLNKATPYMAVGKGDSSVHFVYYTFTTGQDNAYYRKYNYITNTLGPEVTLGNGEASGENDINIAIDSNNKIHIVYSTNHNFGAGTLKYFNNESGTLTEYPTGVTDLISYPEITIDNSNKLHVIYRKSGENRIYYVSRPSGGSFSSPIPIIPANSGLPAYWRGIDTDDNGRLYVSYMNNSSTGPKGFFLVHGINGSFSNPILVFEDSTGSYTSRLNNSVTARGNGQIAVHVEPAGSRNSMIISDIFLKEGVLTLTGISFPSELTEDYKLYDNFPNPFNPSTSISYYLRHGGFVTLKVYDILGNEVRTLVNENMQAGIHSVNFSDEGLSSGTYFYKLKTGDFEDTKKMMLVK